ncbi:uncharacterized protein LOC111068706 [Drosophila obscura]|uniref:uncharacterized protein LOC111068706 n=1 Tax=Drosophila obscura TaxID=7282 RepID=UPI001BB23EF1|nr:uncharacterized protein LOC111068706 [Drosophila obscura]
MSWADKKPVHNPQEEPKKIAIVAPTTEMQAKQDNEPEEVGTATQLKSGSEPNEVKQVQKDNDDDQEDEYLQAKTDTANPQLEIKSSMPEGDSDQQATDGQGKTGTDGTDVDTQPPEEASEDVKYVFSVEKMKQSLLESIVQEAMEVQAMEMEALLLGNKTAAGPPIKSAEDRLAKKCQDREDREAKKAAYEYWLALKPMKKVISTLIKSRQAPKLKWFDVHLVTAGNFKNLKYKGAAHTIDEKDKDPKSSSATKPV